MIDWCTRIYIYVCVCVCVCVKMNRFTNEFECGTLGFYLIKVCSTRVPDFLTLFKRLIMCLFRLGCSFLNSDLFIYSYFIFTSIYFVSLCVYAFTYMHVHPVVFFLFLSLWVECVCERINTYSIYIRLFFFSLFLSLSLCIENVIDIF